MWHTNSTNVARADAVIRTIASMFGSQSSVVPIIAPLNELSLYQHTFTADVLIVLQTCRIRRWCFAGGQAVLDGLVRQYPISVRHLTAKQHPRLDPRCLPASLVLGRLHDRFGLPWSCDRYSHLPNVHQWSASSISRMEIFLRGLYMIA